MKKTYIIPETSVSVLESQTTFLFSSVSVASEEVDGGTDVLVREDQGFWGSPW